MAPPQRNGLSFQIIGLDEFVKGMKVGMVGIPAMMLQAHREVARAMADPARAVAPGRTGAAIEDYATMREARVEVTNEPGHAIGTFMGARRRFGWYAHPRYSGSTGKQFQPWVGNQWDPGEEQGKPYYIGTPINVAAEQAENIFLDAFERQFALAFPLGL